MIPELEEIRECHNAAKGLGEITPASLSLLASYLKDHEYDILMGENDFAEPSPIFSNIFGRDPEDRDE